MEYDKLNRELQSVSLIAEWEISVLSNAAAVIYDNMERLNWCGFYVMKNNRLLLGPFKGKAACTAIDIGCGVCGTAAKLNDTVLVPNVHDFPGHIACDSASNSEIVIPIHKNGQIYGVLDIDSPDLNRFSQEEKLGLEKLAITIEKSIQRF